MLDFDVRTVGAEVGPGATSITLNFTTRRKERVSAKLDIDQVDALAESLADAFGRMGLQAEKDQTLKRIMQIERWEIKPHSGGDGVLLSFLLRGGLDVSLHLPKTAVSRYTEAFSEASAS